MCICTDLDCWTNCDTIQLLIAFFLAVVPYIVIYRLKPKLKIECLSLKNDKENKKIKIKVVNEGLFSAVNLRIEACLIDSNNMTHHFSFEQIDFLILSSRWRGQDNEKIFKTITLSEEEIEKINSSKYKYRVRIHSYHGFSGLGKAEERIFKNI